MFKKTLPLLIIFCLVFSGCLPKPNQADSGVCGDGHCSELESQRKLCPQDCLDHSGEEFEKRLMLGFMIHLEGWNDEMNDEDMFDRHVAAVYSMADKLEKYGAVGTFEARPEFVKATEAWNNNVLKDLEERGHGVGIHADVGGQPDHDLGYITKQITDMKVEAEKISGLEIQHVSGICSSQDWVYAAATAGYEFTTGAVAYCVMSLPEDERPEQFKNCENPASCHDTFPTEVINRIHPWRMQSGFNWLEYHPTGDVVMMPSDGVLYALDEEDSGDLPEGAQATFTEADIDRYFDRLDQALSVVDPLRVNIFYSAWSIGDAERAGDPLIDEWLKKTQKYIDEDKAVWRSIPYMYDEYLKWENR